MSHCTLVTHKLVSTISQCTCCGGVDTALAVVAWAMHLLQWRGYGVNALAAVVPSNSKIADTNLAECNIW